MAHRDRGAPSVDATPAATGTWLLARVLGDAIAHANTAGELVKIGGVDDKVILPTSPVAEVYLDTDAAGEAAAAALVFVGTTAQLLDSNDVELEDSIPLFALATSFPQGLGATLTTPQCDATASNAAGSANPSQDPEPAAPSPTKADLLTAVQHELRVAFPTGRRRRSFLNTYLRPRGAARLPDLSEVELANLLEHVQGLSDAFGRRRDADAP